MHKQCHWQLQAGAHEPPKAAATSMAMIYYKPENYFMHVVSKPYLNKGLRMWFCRNFSPSNLGTALLVTDNTRICRDELKCQYAMVTHVSISTMYVHPT